MTQTQALLLLGLAATLLLAVWAWRRARRLAAQTGLPPRQPLYTDMDPDEPGALLRSRRYGLSGRPDYIVREGGLPIPVEVKPGRNAPRPYRNDVLQLAAYCLLVSEREGRRVPYGRLRYGDRTFRIAYTPALEQELLETLAAMRAAMGQRAAPDRSHDVPARCRHCGLREQCGQGLD